MHINWGGERRINNTFLSKVLLFLFILWIIPYSLYAQATVDHKSQGDLFDEPPIRIAASLALLYCVNQNDARAAFQTWTQSLAKELKIPIDPKSQNFAKIHEMRTALQAEQVDLIYLTTPEYYSVKDLIAPGGVLIPENKGELTEEYVLLTYNDRQVKEIADLKNGEIIVLNNARTSLAQIWLQAFLAKQKLGSMKFFFRNITLSPSVDKAVLPVFFQHSDACLVTRSSYELMVELNPQIGKQLHVVASSPPCIPALCCFRLGYHSPVKKKVLQDMYKIMELGPLRHLLNIVQIGGLKASSLNELSDSVRLLEEYQRLTGRSVQGE